MYGISEQVLARVVATRGRLHCYEELDARRTALLVVDLQNAYMAPGFFAEVAAARDVVPAVNAASRLVRTRGGLVVWVMTSSRGADRSWTAVHRHLLTPAASERRMLELSEGHQGYELWPELEVGPADAKIIKTRYSAFIQGASGLADLLRGRGIDTVVIAGTATNVCCESTARDAMMLDFKTIMLADANAAKDPGAHAATLANFIEYFGDVMTVGELAERLRS
jgi:nicotinamidase-related amidase